MNPAQSYCAHSSLRRISIALPNRATRDALQSYLWQLWFIAAQLVIARGAQVAQNVTTDGVVTSTGYQYDAMGNLTQVQTPGANGTSITKTMAYDIRGRQTNLTDPDAGNYSYAYNGVGEQILQTDARGYATATSYDPFGRKTSRTETQAGGSGLATTAWVYGGDTGGCANAKGLLCSVSYSGSGTATTTTSKSTAYDQYSRPSVTTTTIDGKSFASSVAYDKLGRPLYSVYPQATAQSAPLTLQHLYSGAGYASEVKHATTGQSYWRVDERFADGQLQRATQGGILSTSPSYDPLNLGRIAAIEVKNGINGTSLLSQNFSFESVGNLKTRTLISPTGASAARSESESFAYDALDRLTGHSGSGVPDVGSGSNSYDLAGNLTSKAGLPLGYASNSNRLCAINAATCGAGTGTIAYDSNGNIQSYTRPLNAALPGADGALLNLYEYSAFNLPRLISKSMGGAVVASGEFFYDAGYQRNRQIKRSGAALTGSANIVDDILYVVPGGFEVHRNSAGQVTSSIATIAGSDGVAATVTTTFDVNTGLPLAQNNTATGNVSTDQSGSNTVTKLLLKDHLGSMVGEITLVGTAAGPSVNLGTLVIHGFGPWGNARNAVAALAEGQRGFTGHEHLAELGIIHMNGRLYDAVIGRFLQADPIIQAPHNGQSHNRYSYVLNNPLSFTDPSGFSFWTKWRRPIIGLVAGIITGGLASAWMSAYAIANSTATIFASASGALNGLGVATAAAAGGFASGGINGGNIQSALRGAFMAAITAGVVQGLEGLSGSAGAASGAGDAISTRSFEYLVADASSALPDVPSGYSDGTLQFYKSDAFSTGYGTDTMVISAPKYNDWVANGLDWVGRQASDRSTVIGAVWMGAQAFSGARSVSALRAGQAGRFSQLNNLRVTGDNLTPHHMPQAAANFTSRAEGGALAMSHTEHAATRTFAGKGALTSRLEADMSFRDVLARDINDVRSIVGTRYNEGLKDLLEYYRKNFPELMAKP